MLSGALLEREIWEGKLRRLGAEPLAGKTALNTAEWWMKPGLHPFTVPVEDDGRCEFWAIERLCRSLAPT